MRPALPAVIVTLALALPALAQEPASEPPRTISVTGQGEASAEPDIATVRVGVETQAEAPGAAVDENSARTTRVIEEIRAAGVAPEDIQTVNFSVYPVYEQGGPERMDEGPAIAGFRVSNEVVATVRDIDGIGQVMASVVDAGANRINSLSFGIDDDTAVRDKARRAAVGNARHLAELYAEAAGVSLGDVLSISDSIQGPFPVDAPMMRMEMAQSGAVPIERGENTVTAVVDMTWEIAPAE